MDDMDFVELASCVRPTRRLVDIVAIEMMKAGIGVSLQSPFEDFTQLLVNQSTFLLRNQANSPPGFPINGN